MYVIFRIRCLVFPFSMLSVLHIHLVNLTSKSKYANINNACIISEYINLSALGYDGSDTLLQRWSYIEREARVVDSEGRPQHLQSNSSDQSHTKIFEVVIREKIFQCQEIAWILQKMMRKRIAKRLQWDMDVTNSDPETYTGERQFISLN